VPIGEALCQTSRSASRYLDTDTGRRVAVGRHETQRLILIPYEATEQVVRPVTVHATTRQQVTFRVRTARYVNK